MVGTLRVEDRLEGPLIFGPGRLGFFCSWKSMISKSMLRQ
jgi:hypothetical protein